MIARIFLKDFHGKDGCIRCTLPADSSIAQDYEDHLMGRGQRVKRYPTEDEGHLLVDFRQVAAIKFTEID